MAQNPKKKSQASAPLQKIGLILGALFLLYVIVGFWGIPPLLKPRLEKELSSQLGRRVTIEAIKLNPLALSATTTHLTVFENDGEPFAGFEELFVNVQLASIAKWALTVKEIRLVAPFGVLKLLPDGKLNIDDILARLSQPKPAPDPDAELPRAIITKFQVKDGKFTFADLMGTEPNPETVAPITFTLENLSTLKERQGAYQFVGEGILGGNYQLDGQVSVNPVRVQGSYSVTGTNLNQLWSHIKDHVSFQILKGTIGASGDYVLEIIDGTLNARLQNGRFELNDFQLAEKGEDTVLISLPSFSARGVGADLKTQEIIVEQVNSADARFVSWLAPDGSFKLGSLLLGDLQKLQQKKSSGTAEPQETASQSWHVVINKIEISDWGAVLEDRTLPKPARFTVDNIRVFINDLSTHKDSKADVAIALLINQTGTVKVEGTAGIDPLTADLKVTSDKIALKSFQPYVDVAVKAQVTAGTAGSSGRIIYKGKQSQPQIRYEGDARVDGLEIKDRTLKEDFIQLSQFKTSGIVLDLLPNKFHAAEVSIDKPHARVTIDQNGSIKVVQAFSPVEKKDEKGQQDLLQSVINLLILQFKGPMPMDIKLVQLNDFTADFVDESVSPAYTTRLEITKGRVKDLSSDPSARSDFTIEGNIDKSATIESSGQMNPMNALQYTKVDFAMRDFGLEPVSPYSGKFVGYKIEQGKLNLELKYHVDDDQVNGDNIITIDQLTLGDQVDSPDALNLPVALGVALLKDDNGRITLQVPVKGSVKDPQFDFGQAIKSALTGTIDEVGNSPFAAIGEIEGFKGEELRLIAFEFGLAELNAREIKKLNALSKFLNKRKSLTLAIEAVADREKDWAAMTGESAEKKAPSEMKNSQKVPQEKTPSTGQEIDDKQLQQLAQMRAEQVKTYLIQQGKVAAKRVELRPVQLKSTADGDSGQVALFLSAQ